MCLGLLIVAACSGAGTTESTTSSTSPTTTSSTSTTSTVPVEDRAAALAEALGQSAWDSYQAESEAGDLGFEVSRSQAFCVGKMLVDVVGYEELEQAGVTVEVVLQQESFDPGELYDFDPDDEELTIAYFDGFANCLDVAGMMSTAYSLELGVSEASARCLVDGLLEDEALRYTLARSFVDRALSPAQAFSEMNLRGDLFDLADECLTDEELFALGFPGTGGQVPDLEGWVVPDGYIAHHSEAFGYSIAFPDDWLVLELDDNEFARAETFALIEEVFDGQVPDFLLAQMETALDQGLSLMAFAELPEAEASYAPTFSILALPAPPGIDLDEIEASLPLELAAIPGTEVHSLDRVALPAGVAVHAEYTLNLGGLAIASDYYILPARSWVYAITMGDREDRPNREAFREILDTFRGVGS